MPVYWRHSQLVNIYRLLLGTLAVQVCESSVASIYTPWNVETTVGQSKLLICNLYSLPTRKVYFLCLGDLIQTGLATDYAWKTLVSHWGDPTILVEVPRSSLSLSFINPILSAIVQIFFAWRLWYLMPGGNVGKIFPVLIVLVALMQCLSALIASIRFTVTSDLSQLPALAAGFTVWLAGSFVADILIAICMVFVLKRAQAQAVSKRTETLVTRLLMNAVNTGAVTAVAAFVELILFVVYKDNNFHQAPAFLLGKLYTNVLLANLNSRAQNKDLGMDTQIHTTMSEDEEAQPKGSSESIQLSTMGMTSSLTSRTGTGAVRPSRISHMTMETMTTSTDGDAASRYTREMPLTPVRGPNAIQYGFAHGIGSRPILE
ncbi:hypothetical protein K435DRAFT_790744 [Dendrothele bispora CBS 962.96]|uniref:DUF6534 domain-containing protein n=1 Tax=Dendrothele bispora (strain CBS 962.96) TaxID=1314807 RepID=A0A4S8MQ77_DENBC|nr:hypothetical protein K435DRAFT_790744 [Dendrothele bispora CBS 962.96]